MRKLRWVAIFLFTSTLAIAAPQKFVLSPQQSKLEFTAHTKMFDVTGKFKKWQVSVIEASDKSQQVSISIDIRSLDTGIGRRDKGLREMEYFDENRYPKATFVSSSIKETKPGHYLVSGKLQIKDVTKEIQVPVTRTEETQDGVKFYRVRGSLQLDRNDYHISHQPTLFFLPKINKEVDIRFDVLLKPIE